MTAPISATPWDLRSGEKWAIESADMRLGGDHNNEVIVDAQGNVVAYVSGNNDEGGNGALLAAAPALRDALLSLVTILRDEGNYTPESERARAVVMECGIALARAGAT